MTSKKWIIVCCSIIFGFIFYTFFTVHQPWLHQENLSNLKRQEGILKLTNRLKLNTYYLEMENNETSKVVFVYPSMSRFEEYEGKYVTVWKKDKYVYQMKMEDDVIFPISAANDEIFLFNCAGIITDLTTLWTILASMLYIMYISSDSNKKI